ncbi:MAG: 1-acyl-sn-glycerol-3-phosphate acyltransferase [Asticcacaulis sp.]
MLWLYGSMAVFGLGLSPLLLLPPVMAMAVIRWWARAVLFGARMLVGLKVEFRGLEHRPTGAALVAGKHMSMLDTIAPFTVLAMPCYVLKQELIYLPFFGWYAWRTGMVPVRRDEAAKALKSMVASCRERAEGQAPDPDLPRGHALQSRRRSRLQARRGGAVSRPRSTLPPVRHQFGPVLAGSRHRPQARHRGLSVPAADPRRSQARRTDDRDEGTAGDGVAGPGGRT